MDKNSVFYDESGLDRFSRTARDYPMLPIGIGGLIIVCLHGVYKYKYRGSMSTSVYLMQLRVTAQGTFVACLAAGLGYTMFRQHVLHEKPKTRHQD